MKLQTLRPRLATLPGRLSQVGTIEIERLRGRTGTNRRRRWLEQHPLCCRCDAEDRVSAATVPDHIVPLWANGPDTDSNLQSLCKAHHDAKSACEERMRRAGGWMATACTCGQHG